MSKIVSDVIRDLKQNPKSWTATKGQKGDFFQGNWTSIRKDNIRITNIGNSCMSSIIDLKIDESDIKFHFMDAWRLESASMKWYKQCDIAAYQTT